MERKTDIEQEMFRNLSLEILKILSISPEELIENLENDFYKNNRGVLENLKIVFNTKGDVNVNNGKFKKILELLRDKGLSSAVTSLDVSFGFLTELNGIEQLTALIELNVSYNRLTTLAGIEQLKALTRLDVDHNQLKTLMGIAKLKGLIYLHVNHNQLTTLAGIEHLSRLKILDVSNNQLERLPVTLCNRVDLKLNVDANPLQTGTPTTLIELELQLLKLRQAYHRRNEISDLIAKTVPELRDINGIIVECIVEYDDLEPSPDVEQKIVKHEDSLHFMLKNLSKEELAVLDPEIQKEVDELDRIESLHEAMKDCDIRAFKNCLFEAIHLSTNLDTKTGNAGDTLLHAAAPNNFRVFTTLLLASGANPNLMNTNGDTPVAIAAINGRHEILAVYQEFTVFASLNARHHNAALKEITPETLKAAVLIYKAAESKNPNNAELKEVRKILDIMLQDLGLLWNATLGLLLWNATKVQKILAKDPAIDLPVKFNEMRLLNAAIIRDNKKIVKLFLKASENPNVSKNHIVKENIKLFPKASSHQKASENPPLSLMMWRMRPMRKKPSEYHTLNRKPRVFK